MLSFLGAGCGRVFVGSGLRFGLRARGSFRGSLRGSVSGKGSFGEVLGGICGVWRRKIPFGGGSGSEPRGIVGTGEVSLPGNVCGVPPPVGSRRMLLLVGSPTPLLAASCSRACRSVSARVSKRIG